ncbi:MAG: hypothetical protein AAFR55_09660, partial [Pseudomonadota bacterium]
MGAAFHRAPLSARSRVDRVRDGDRRRSHRHIAPIDITRIDLPDCAIPATSPAEGRARLNS